MGYCVKILADSISPVECRLTTFELTYPRFIHSELMTHRAFSRNAASSRAIPIEKMIQRVTEDPAEPVHWGKNQKGMQANEELDDWSRETARATWFHARDAAVDHAQTLVRLGVHKQIVNRLLEPWMWITVIVSATDYGNYFNLRCHKDAQPEFRRLAEMMWDAYSNSEPRLVQTGDWHLPLIFLEDTDIALADRIKLSVARCARVSYLTHDGRRDPEADLALHDRLAASGHWSPFEHAAEASPFPNYIGNFRGWLQYRKGFPTENRPTFINAAEAVAS